MDTNTISEVPCKQDFRVNVFRKKATGIFTRGNATKKRKEKETEGKKARQRKCIPRFLKVFVVQLRDA